MEPSVPRRRSILHSPIYWIYLFCTAGLIALLLVGHKFSERQAAIERTQQGRLRARQSKIGEQPSTPMSSPDDRAITLVPLYILLGAGFVVTWVALWWKIYGKRNGPTPSLAENQDDVVV